ncbi:hypothetical protein BTO20_36295 [Mycobacterium dioxanotrophicus]|uniref:DUF3800 domain-containing protein n=1 Tax=Mycobacterium dioxanotrophicus TaxID=482462 RepID=A0A1Y0CEA2_9MYCO|nr:hypothetical protein BTO20_36295 [Mycobacterium dioxanotrophicus]
MLFAYVDESGNTGLPDSGGSAAYTLGCVMVDADLWPASFDEIIAFRRRIRDTFRVPMRAEIKANYLLRNSGDLRGLNLAPRQRFVIYRAHLRQLRMLNARAFAVVVDKARHPAATQTDYFDLAWEGLLQRLERTSSAEKQVFSLLHDQGENDAVRRWTRKARRHLPAGSAYGTGSIRRRAHRLVDDPIPLKSSSSYFIQMSDLVAYAAFRAHIAPTSQLARICPQTMWENIGPATFTAASGFRPRSAPGIVLR